MLYHVLAFLDQWYARVSTISTDVLVKKNLGQNPVVSVLWEAVKEGSIKKERLRGLSSFPNSILIIFASFYCRR